MVEMSSPDSYYTQVVSQQLAAAGGAATDQPELTAIYQIAGERGGTYGLRAAGGQLYAVPAEQIASPDVRTVMSYDDWYTFVASGASDPLVDYVRQGKVGIVKSIKGLVRLELTRSDGSLWRSATTFGGQAEPAITLMMANDDYRAMLSGALNGQLAFLTGKLKFEGSLPLLMQIGALSS